MSTGDLRNNVEVLRSEVRSLSFPLDELDLEAVSSGNSVFFLPLLHHILLDESLLLARFLSEKGYQLYHMDDKHFVEGAFRVIRNEFSYRPSLTVDQFLSTKGFAERKIIFICDVIKLCRRKGQELERDSLKEHKENAGTAPTAPTASASTFSDVASQGEDLNKNGHMKSARKSISPASKLVNTSPALTSTKPYNSSSYVSDQNINSKGNITTSNATLDATKNRNRNKGGAEVKPSSVHAAATAKRTGQPVTTGAFHHHHPTNAPILVSHPQNASQAGVTPTGQSWRPKKPLTLQTGLVTSSSQDETRSPTSSGPVSPVSTTSAASAPPVFRQAPIKAKPDMIGHAFAFHHSSPHEPDLLAGPHLVHNVNRGMECWVSSPPPPLDRAKKKDPLVIHTAKGHSSPRIRPAARNSPGAQLHRSSSTGSLTTAQPAISSSSSSSSSSTSAVKKTGPRSSVWPSNAPGAKAAPGSPLYHQFLLQHHHHYAVTSQHHDKHVESNAGDSDSGDEKDAQSTGTSVSAASVQSMPLPAHFHQNANQPYHQHHQRLSRSTARAKARFVTSRSDSKAVPQNIARRLSLPSTPGPASIEHTSSVFQKPTTPAQLTQEAHSKTAGDGASREEASAGHVPVGQLVEQFSRMASALDHLATLPSRMDDIERKMMVALESMDKRISDLDHKIQKVSVTETQEPYRGTAAKQSTIQSPSRQSHVPQQKQQQQRGLKHDRQTAKNAKDSPRHLVSDVEGIDDFLKVIEERFKETETVLAESESQS